MMRIYTLYKSYLAIVSFPGERIFYSDTQVGLREGQGWIIAMSEVRLVHLVYSEEKNRS